MSDQRAHAILGPSGWERWSNCPSSAQAEEEAVRLDPTLAASGIYADEGTLCHSLAELFLRGWRDFGGLPPDYELDTLRTNRHYTPELEEAALTYVELVKDHYSQALAQDSSAQLYIERRVDLREWVPEGFGTTDCAIVFGNTLKVIDLKGGKGVVVDAVDNGQTRLYAAGILREIHEFWPIARIECLISQPRLDRVTHEVITVAELHEWLQTKAVPAAKIAWSGKGGFKAGDWCQFCKIKSTCRTRAESYQQAAQAAFADPPVGPATLSPEEIAALLPLLSTIKSWVTDVQEHALNAAVRGDVRFPGWKVVEGRSHRTYSDADALVRRLVGEGIPEPLLFERKLHGITAMEKAVGKKKLAELAGDLIVKPPGKPTLVPEGDSRPEVDRNAAAQAAFDSLTEDY